MRNSAWIAIFIEFGQDIKTKFQNASSPLKARYNLTMKVVSGEDTAADNDNAEEWASSKLQDILQEYAPEDVLNMDKSALFF